jgi:hypothetical protein
VQPRIMNTPPSAISELAAVGERPIVVRIAPSVVPWAVQLRVAAASSVAVCGSDEGRLEFHVTGPAARDTLRRFLAEMYLAALRDHAAGDL